MVVKDVFFSFVFFYGIKNCIFNLGVFSCFHKIDLFPWLFILDSNLTDFNIWLFLKLFRT